MNQKYPRSPSENKHGKYRSGLEKDMAEFLGRRTIKFDYETGPVPYLSKIRSGQCILCGSKQVAKRRTYLPDFRVGSIILETKGKLTSAERTKFIDIKQSNPELDLRLVFQRDNRIRKGSDIYYSDWAKSHGFKWCIGTKLPPKWVKELKKEALSAKDTTP